MFGSWTSDSACPLYQSRASNSESPLQFERHLLKVFLSACLVYCFQLQRPFFVSGGFVSRFRVLNTCAFWVKAAQCFQQHHGFSFGVECSGSKWLGFYCIQYSLALDVLRSRGCVLGLLLSGPQSPCYVFSGCICFIDLVIFEASRVEGF